ncbi:DUF7010 family protein [Shewanella maritima]|uniref:DUF7010 family protein n=1 Tax=Shewanella maritima TaxID=2520507 RepID=UPI003736C917
MTLQQAQQNMDHAYLGGGPGVLVSGLVWGIAAIVAAVSTPFTSMLTLFFGGMLIHPLGMVLAKVFKRSGMHQPDNPLAKLAFESTVILFVGLFIAFYVANINISLFYPIMLLTIGVRYLTFQTLYGNRIYWLLGAVLMAGGVACMVMQAPFITGVVLGSVTEIVFGLLIIVKAKQANM